MKRNLLLKGKIRQLDEEEMKKIAGGAVTPPPGSPEYNPGGDKYCVWACLCEGESVLRTRLVYVPIHDCTPPDNRYWACPTGAQWCSERSGTA